MGVITHLIAGVPVSDLDSGIGLMTPADVHYGRAEADRARVLDAAYAATPEGFVRHPPRPPALPTAAPINKPADERAAAHFGQVRSWCDGPRPAPRRRSRSPRPAGSGP